MYPSASEILTAFTKMSTDLLPSMDLPYAII